MDIPVLSIGAFLRVEHHVTIERPRSVVYAHLLVALTERGADVRSTVTGHEIRFRISIGHLSAAAMYRLTPAGDDATTVAYSLELEPRRLERLRRRLIGRRMRREVTGLDQTLAGLGGLA